MENVLYMYPNKISMFAPTVVDSMIYGGNVPEDRLKTLDTAECTTICFVGGTKIDVKESMEIISKYMLI